MARRSRAWPLRARLTAAFAAVVAVVLAVTGVLVWGQFARDLDGAIDDGLAARGRDLAALATTASSARALLAQSGERIAQLEAPDGELLAATRATGREPLLAPADARAALREPHNFTRAGIADSEHGARLHAFAISDPQLGPLVAVIGEPLDLGDGTATGSGVVLDRAGHILTNAHVIDGAGRVSVTFEGDRAAVPATVTGRDTSSDLAVLRVDPAKAKLHPIALGDSHARRHRRRGRGDRQPVRARSHDHHRHRLRRAARDPGAGRLHHPQRAADGRGDQPRQQRRPAARRPGPRDRHQQPDRHRRVG